MARDCEVNVGIKIIEPCWSSLCVSMSGHVGRAIGYLDSGKVEQALNALRDAQSVIDIAMMVEATQQDQDHD